nr:hypothetical protein [Amycolatopsis vancoresmycina]
MSALPPSATALPSSFATVSRSPRNTAASSALNTGATETSRLAVPAGTCTSPQLSSTWYALIPASPHPAINGRSARRGRRTPSTGAASSRTAEATASRANDNPATP